MIYTAYNGTRREKKIAVFGAMFSHFAQTFLGYFWYGPNMACVEGMHGILFYLYLFFGVLCLVIYHLAPENEKKAKGKTSPRVSNLS